MNILDTITGNADCIQGRHNVDVPKWDHEDDIQDAAEWHDAFPCKYCGREYHYTKNPYWPYYGDWTYVLADNYNYTPNGELL